MFNGFFILKNRYLDLYSNSISKFSRYDSGTIRMKRFVNALLGQVGPLSVVAPSETTSSSTVSPVSTTRIKLNSLKAGLPSSIPKPAPSSSTNNAANKLADVSQFNAELVSYFGQQFPGLINELLVSLMSAATHQQQQTSTSKQVGVNHKQQTQSAARSPLDTFLQDVRCFKCGKFSTKLKHSLFRHLHDEHQFDLREMERLYEQHVQQQLALIDEQHLVEKYERGQRDAAQQQLVLFKEARVKSEQQRKEAAAATATTPTAVVMNIDGQPTLLQISDATPAAPALGSATVMAVGADGTELIVPGKLSILISTKKHNYNSDSLT